MSAATTTWPSATRWRPRSIRTVPEPWCTPTRGPLQVYAQHPCRLQELSEKGRAAFFSCEFVEAGGESQPAAGPDTPSLAFDAADDVFAQLADAFNDGVAYIYDGVSSAVQAATNSMLGTVVLAVGAFLTAPGSAAQALALDLPLLAAVTPDDAAGYATAVAGLVQDYVAGIATDASAAATPDARGADRLPGQLRLPPLPPGSQLWPRSTRGAWHIDLRAARAIGASRQQLGGGHAARGRERHSGADDAERADHLSRVDRG